MSEIKALLSPAPSAASGLAQLHDRLGACIDQVGHPDYSLRELVNTLRDIRDEMFAASHQAPVGEILSYCCGWPIETHRNVLGQEYHWCRVCERQLKADGSDGEPKSKDEHGYHPSKDLSIARSLIEDAYRFQSEQKGPRAYTEKERILWCREAFFAGASWRERVSNVSGDGVVKAKAEEVYPMPRPT